MQEHKALQSVRDYFKMSNGKLLVGGITCSEIAAKVGTPFYAYDLSVAKKKYDLLRNALSPAVDIHYAIKANPHPGVVQLFKDTGTGFDVASAGELKTVLDTGATAASIGFAGPGKRDSEIREACRAGIGSLNVESLGEIERANRIGREEGKSLQVCLRVNPAYELLGSGMKMGGGPKPFGIDQEQVPIILEQFSQWPNLKFMGFHIFAGSQNLSAQAIVSAFEQALDAVIEFLPLCPAPPTMVNLGGGFGIPYFASDIALDIQRVGAGVQAAIDIRKQQLEGIQLIVESGRYLVGESGVYVCRVLDRKESRGEVFLVVDGGMHHHLAASGNLGQVIKRNYPIALPEHIRAGNAETVNIVGPLCTPLDRLGTKVALPRAEPGELIAVFASGAYGYSASPRSFLGHPDPMEIVLG